MLTHVYAVSIVSQPLLKISNQNKIYLKVTLFQITFGTSPMNFVYLHICNSLKIKHLISLAVLKVVFGTSLNYFLHSQKP